MNYKFYFDRRKNSLTKFRLLTVFQKWSSVKNTQNLFLSDQKNNNIDKTFKSQQFINNFTIRNCLCITLRVRNT